MAPKRLTQRERRRQAASRAPRRTNRGRPSGPSEGKQISQSKRAGLAMPVGRIKRFIRTGRYAPRVGKSTPVYLAAVLEYLVAEVLELAGNAASDNRRKTIAPRHVMMGIRSDEELGRLCANVVFPHTGVLPNIRPELMKNAKKNKKKKTKKLSASQVY